MRSDFFPSSSRVLNFSASNVLGSVVLQSPNGDSGAGELVIAVACADAGCYQPAHASRPSTPTTCKPRCWRMMMLSQPFRSTAIACGSICVFNAPILTRSISDVCRRADRASSQPSDLGRRKVVKTTARLRPQAGKTLFPIKLNNGRLQVKQSCLSPLTVRLRTVAHFPVHNRRLQRYCHLLAARYWSQRKSQS